MTVFGGSIVDTPEKREEIINNYGIKHIRNCVSCGKEYFSPRFKSLTCYGCWYENFLAEAESNYADVFLALRNAGFETYMDQTGGMCLAIRSKLGENHYFYLTNLEDTLSFEREEEDGWTLGVYSSDYEADDGMPLTIFDGEDYITDPVKSADTAVTLANHAKVELEKFLS